MTTGVDFCASSSDLLEIALAEIEGPIQHGRGGQEIDMVGGLAHQTIEHGRISLARGTDGIGDAVRRILVEVEAGGAEGQIDVEDQHVLAQMLADGPGDVVRDGRSPGAALGRDEADGPADRRSTFGGKQVGDGVDDRLRAGRHDQVFGYA